MGELTDQWRPALRFAAYVREVACQHPEWDIPETRPETAFCPQCASTRRDRPLRWTTDHDNRCGHPWHEEVTA